jgi:hypothetical protein
VADPAAFDAVSVRLKQVVAARRVEHGMAHRRAGAELEVTAGG